MRNRAPNARTANAAGTFRANAAGTFRANTADRRVVQVYMPGELFAWIKDEAARNGRTLAGQMRDFAERCRKLGEPITISGPDAERLADMLREELGSTGPLGATV